MQKRKKKNIRWDDFEMVLSFCSQNLLKINSLDIETTRTYFAAISMVYKQI